MDGGLTSYGSPGVVAATGCSASAGRDSLSGGGGNDRMYANDCGRDRLNGGPGRDRGVIDRGRLDGLISVESRLRARC